MYVIDKQRKGLTYGVSVGQKWRAGNMNSRVFSVGIVMLVCIAVLSPILFVPLAQDAAACGTSLSRGRGDCDE